MIPFLICAVCCAVGAVHEWRKAESPGWFIVFSLGAAGNLAFAVTP